MAQKDFPQPTDSELQILRVLWKLGRGTVKQVHAALGENAAYTTVLTFLQNMTEKGIVKRDETSRAHVYEPAYSQEKTQQALIRNLMRKAFEGSSAHLVVQALSSQTISKKELEKIRDLIDQLEKKKS